MGLVQNLTSYDSLPNQVNLTWTQPVGFNTENSSIIVTKTSNYFPSELYNSAFPTKVSDITPFQIFNGQTIAQVDSSGVSVVGEILTDTNATFPTNPPLNGRILRDSNSNVFKILSNTATSVTLDGTPASGIYVILPDFPASVSTLQTFEASTFTEVGSGFITNLVQIVNGFPTIITFQPDQLANLIFYDGVNKYIIKTNTVNTLTFFESTTPVINNGMTILSSATNNRIIQYVDNFLTAAQAAIRVGTGLLDDQFYYYTAFDLGNGLNVAQAEFATHDNPKSTQTVNISTANNNFGDILYNYWPTVFRQLDATGDLADLMTVFGFQFQELHSFINTFNLQDADNVYYTALQALADQTALPSVGYSIGIDTWRRIARNMLTAWKLKGSKQGIALFIKILTTWDITGGTGDINGAITDFTPNVEAFRFYDPALSGTNTRFSQADTVAFTNPGGTTTVIESVFVPGGRFVTTLAGIVIPGFTTFREFVITLPHIALFVGTSTAFTGGSGTTTMTDSSANFGPTDSLVGNYLLPNQSEPNDLFLITANTNTTITVQGKIINTQVDNSYAVLSPLNTNRFIILNKLISLYIPFGTFNAFNFT